MGFSLIKRALKQFMAVWWITGGFALSLKYDQKRWELMDRLSNFNRPTFLQSFQMSYHPINELLF